MGGAQEDDPSLWRSARDPNTGQVYYYHKVTRASQWDKPLALCTPSEREAILSKEKRQRDFFKDMEANIRRKLQQGLSSADIHHQHGGDGKASAGSTADEQLPSAPGGGSFGMGGAEGSAQVMGAPEGASGTVGKRESLRLVAPARGIARTISTMDDSVLAQLAGPPSSPPGPGQRSPGAAPADANASSTFGGVGAPAWDTLKSTAFSLDLASPAVAGPESGASSSTSGGGCGGGDTAPALRRLPMSAASDLRGRRGGGSAAGAAAAAAWGGVGARRRRGTAPTVTGLPATPTVEGVKGEAGAGDWGGAGMLEPPVGIARRNSTSTIFLDPNDTMTHPDQDVTIRCVCAVYRAHILEAVEGGARESTQGGGGGGTSSRGFFGGGRGGGGLEGGAFAVFDDHPTQDADKAIAIAAAHAGRPLTRLKEVGEAAHSGWFGSGRRTAGGGGAGAGAGAGAGGAGEPEVPSLHTIAAFYRDVYHRSKLSFDVIILSLVYVERLITETQGRLLPRPSNWRSLLMAALILSSKVWDDHSMWNGDFSVVFPSFTLARINELEVAMLEALQYNVKVEASQYAKYYFHLRSMCARSGLGGDTVGLHPLDIDAAKSLEDRSSKLALSSPSVLRPPQRIRKSTTIHSVDDARYLERVVEDGYHFTDKSSAPAGLEEVVHNMESLMADDGPRPSPRATGGGGGGMGGNGHRAAAIATAQAAQGSALNGEVTA